jgi:hypothetical protein
MFRQFDFTCDRLNLKLLPYGQALREMASQKLEKHLRALTAEPHQRASSNLANALDTLYPQIPAAARSTGGLKAAYHPYLAHGHSQHAIYHDAEAAKLHAGQCDRTATAPSEQAATKKSPA